MVIGTYAQILNVGWVAPYNYWFRELYSSIFQVYFINLEYAVKQLKTRFLEKTGFLKSIPKSDLLSRISEK